MRAVASPAEDSTVQVIVLRAVTVVRQIDAKPSCSGFEGRP